MADALSKSKVLLIIPCYNEQNAIIPLLKEIADCNLDYETVVVDDGSTDDTYQIAKQVSLTVKLLKNLGIGGAVQTGIKYAERNKFDFCVQIDGDGQHPPNQVARLLEAYAQNPASIIIGSRYLTHNTFRSTWTRRFGSKVIAKTLNLLFPSCRVTDPTSGMRLMNQEAIKFFANRYPHDFPEPISLAWAFKAGLNAKEIAVEMREREHGSSSIIGLKPLGYMIRVLGYIFLARIIHLT